MSSTNEPGRDPARDAPTERYPAAGATNANDRADANGRISGDHQHTTDGNAAAVPAEQRGTLREEVVERQKERFGGIKFGSAFFGWLTATGLAAVLAALVSAIAIAALGGVEQASDQAMTNLFGGVVIGSIVVIVILFVAYYCGGYVAGRMARFSGAKQGLAVWLWAVVIAIVLAILGAILGTQFNVLARLNAFPALPTSGEDITVAGIITLILAAAASLGGAVLGGLAGMRFHRRVDREGLGR